MTKTVFTAAAAIALPLATFAHAQAPAAIDLETVAPLPGTWAYRAYAGGSEAAFFDAARARRTVVRCNRTVRTVSLIRPGVAAAAPTLSVWTTTSTRSIPARFQATGELSADLRATDPLLDAIAFSRGRFATGGAGAALLAVPATPEVEKVIEDCRT
ncbi:hypothetical protein H8M03_03925 [Sphingomonas sabuli]|uniref:Uncharacterized protein n=1 Tax=Sphingomonas sabuli TaxID=2764186 RepID=A0A7G9L4E4_9SPHN|nr:hypothetical protein [Sphingomonas sabuli]QNM83493.1 hypothetical protein H8M03_03925 [Sphingomonas sabuli]